MLKGVRGKRKTVLKHSVIVKWIVIMTESHYITFNKVVASTIVEIARKTSCHSNFQEVFTIQYLKHNLSSPPSSYSLRSERKVGERDLKLEQ